MIFIRLKVELSCFVLVLFEYTRQAFSFSFFFFSIDSVFEANVLNLKSGKGFYVGTGYKIRADTPPEAKG